MGQRAREFVFQQYGLDVINIVVIIVDVLVYITIIIISDVICAEIFFSFNSPNFWENLSHPLLSGIRSELDEVSAFIVFEL